MCGASLRRYVEAVLNPDCMKIVSLLFIGACCSFGAFAQKCEAFPLMQEGKLVSISNFSRAGVPNGKVVYQVLEANPAASQARIHSVVFDGKGNVVSDGITFAQCTGTHYRADIHLFMSRLAVKQVRSFVAREDQYVEYPLVMKSGEMLREARYALRAVNSEGITTDWEITIENRMVQGEELVMTPFGSKLCYKIKSHINCRTQVSGVTIPLSIDNTEWFSPELGIVKNEAKSYRSELTSID